MWVIPCIQALPDWVALVSFSTELGDVNMCLNACIAFCEQEKKMRMSWSKPKLATGFWKAPPKVHFHHTLDLHMPASAINHPRQLFHHWKAFCTHYVVTEWEKQSLIGRWTHPASFQFKPAGQRRASVMGWWKPWCFEKGWMQRSVPRGYPV